MSDVMALLTFLALLSEQKGPQQGQPGPPGPPGPGTMPETPGTMPATPASSPTAAPTAAPAAAPVVVTPATPATPATPITPAPAAPPGGAVPMPPWPTAAVPADLPPFPGPGWVPDVPETPAVSARAAYWNQYLWDQPNRKIVRAFVQENFGGQWLTFAAAWHPGDKGAQTFMATEAWRTAAAAAPVAPSSSPTAVQAAAVAMNTALASHGYKLADQGLYKSFQQAAALSADGFPGTGTMTALRNVLTTMGVSVAPVKVYPWRSTGAYDGVNAPTVAEWHGVAAAIPAASPATSPATAPMPGSPGPMPTAVSPYPGPGAYHTNAAYIQRLQTALQWLSLATGNPAYNPQGIDGKDGPHTEAAVKAFQGDHGLSQDGQAGAQTAAALDAAIATLAPHS